MIPSDVEGLQSVLYGRQLYVAQSIPSDTLSMMDSALLLIDPNGILFGLGLAFSLAICWLGYESYSRWRIPGTGAFCGFVMSLGVAGVLGGLISIVYEPIIGEQVVWSRIVFLLFVFASVPWALFALQYTGTYPEPSWKLIVLLLVPVGVFYTLSGLELLGQVEGFVLIAIVGGIGAVISVYHIGLVALGMYLIARTIYEYGHLRLRLGVVLVFLPLGALLGTNIVIAGNIQNPPWVAGAYSSIYGLLLAAMGLAVFRYRMFDSSPAVGAIGKERIIQETGDMVFVVDRDERVITLNSSAVDTLGIDRSEALGDPLESTLNRCIADLRSQETVSVETVDGTRQYDPELSTLTDQHDRSLGTMLSLRDVTGRKLREQRLMVLNRILRHTVRNKVDVVKSHTEMLDGSEDDEHHREKIMDASESLADIAQRGRAVDQFIDKSSEPTAVDIPRIIEQRLERKRPIRQDVTISIEPPEATVVTNREALIAALDSAIENAISYADTVVTISGQQLPDSVEVTISDDGPGIPEHELEVIDAGEETSLSHSSGLGLWQLKWGVTAMNGELSIDTSAGTAVTIRIPNLSDARK